MKKLFLSLLLSFLLIPSSILAQPQPGGRPPTVFLSDCSTFVGIGFCQDTDNGRLYYYNRTTAAVVEFSSASALSEGVYDISYATLALANTAAYDAGKTLIVTQNWTLVANTTLTANVHVVKGGSFTKASTYTLAFSGGFQNPSNSQCFIGFSAGDVTGLNTAKPNWFLVNTTPGTTDMIIAINNAVSATIVGGTISILPEAYNITSAITITKRIGFWGEGSGAVLVNNGIGDALIFDGTGVGGLDGVSAGNFVINGRSGSADALKLKWTHRSYFQNILIPSAVGKGLYLMGSLLNVFDGIKISTNLPAIGATPNIDPTYGVLLEVLTAIGSNANVFNGFVAEGTGTGIDVNGSDNVWNGGSSEGNTIGILLHVDQDFNTFNALHMESNGTDISGPKGKNSFISRYSTVATDFANYFPNLQTRSPVSGDIFDISDGLPNYAKAQIINAVYSIITSTNVNGFWIFDRRTTATTIIDRGTKTHNLDLSLGANSLTPGMAGLASYLNFDDSGDFWDTVDHNDFSFGDGSTDSAFSLVILINPNVSTSSTLIAKYSEITDATQKEWKLSFHTSGGKLICALYDDSVPAEIGVYSDSNYSADVGTWHTYVMTYSGSGASSGIKLYRDGVLLSVAENPNGVYVAMENKSAKVGSYWLTTSGTKGYVGNAMYGIAIVAAEELSATQVMRVDTVLRGYAGNNLL